MFPSRPIPSLLAIWQFENWPMLLWGAAAVVPLLIHLWSRRQYREMHWAAMTFLLAALQKNSRRIQIEQWILLALRIAALLVFALALGDPRQLASGPLLGGGGGSRSLIVLVLDGSYSMEYRSGGDSRLAQAKQEARRTVEQAGLGTGFLAVLMTDAPRALIADPAFDVQDILAEIDAAAIEHSGASLPKALELVDSLLQQAAKRHPQLVERHVIFFSDLGRTAWGDIREPAARDRLARWSEQGVRLALADVGVPAAANHAVVRLAPREPWVIAGRPASFQAEIRNFGGAQSERVAAALIVDGQRVAESRVELAPGGAATALFTHRFNEPGERVVEVRLAGDNLSLDDRRWLVVDVRTSVRVLCIGGRPNETKFLAAALAPDTSTGLAVTEAGEAALLEAKLSDYDAVFLANVGRLTRDEAAVLRHYVASGGALAVFLGDLVQAESYNEVSPGSEGPLFPAQLGPIRHGGPFLLDPLDYRHPLVEAFRGQPRSGLLTTPIWSYVALQPQSQARIALQFAGGGEPALLEASLGRGRVVLCATAASPASLDLARDPPQPWSMWGTWPSFPPLVQEIVAHTALARDRSRTLTVGEEASGAWTGPRGASAALVVTPSDRRERIPLSDELEEPRWNYAGGRLSGVYEIRDEAASAPRARFALNPDPRESDLERLPPELLPSSLDPISATGPAAPAIQTAGPRQEWFRTLLLLVMLLLAAESTMAWRLGRGAA